MLVPRRWSDFESAALLRLLTCLPLSVRVFVAVESIDIRGSFDALAGAVRRLGIDPVEGHLYLFLNKRRRLLAYSG